MTDLFTSILNMSITAGYVALAVIAIRLFLVKVPKVFSYALWSAVLIRLISPVSFTSKFSLLGIIGHKAQSSGIMEYVPRNIGLMPQPAVDVGVNVINQSVNSSLPAAAPVNSVNPMQVIMWLGSVVWITGIAVLLAYSIISYIKILKKVETATLVRDNIFETDRIATPFVCGFIKPRIYIPMGLDESRLSYIIAHEQTHIERFDYLVKPFAFCILILHWFNPIMWVSFILMSKDMEMSCDESVLKKMGSDIKTSYSKSLLALSVRKSGLLMGSPLAFGENNIKSRIKNILKYKKPAFGVMAVAMIITAGLLITFTANPKSPTVPPASPDHHSGYNTDVLLANRNPYVGNNVKDIALIDAMPLPAGIVRNKVELQTDKPPYGITINLDMKDASGVTVQGAISGQALTPNVILLFGLIDNVDVIHVKLIDHTGNYEGANYTFNYTRETISNLMGGDVRLQTTNLENLENLIDQITNKSFAKMSINVIEKN